MMKHMKKIAAFLTIFSAISVAYAYEANDVDFVLPDGKVAAKKVNIDFKIQFPRPYNPAIQNGDDIHLGFLDGSYDECFVEVPESLSFVDSFSANYKAKVQTGTLKEFNCYRSDYKVQIVPIMHTDGYTPQAYEFKFNFFKVVDGVSVSLGSSKSKKIDLATFNQRG